MFARPVVITALTAAVLILATIAAAGSDQLFSIDRREEVRISKRTSGSVNANALLRWETVEVSSACLRPRVEHFVVTLLDENRRVLREVKLSPTRNSVQVADLAQGRVGRFYWQVQGEVSFVPNPRRNAVCHMMIPANQVVPADGGTPFLINIRSR